MNTGKSLWPVYGLLSATLLLTGCFNEPQDESVSASEGRIKVAHLLPPRSGLTPLSDDAFKLSRWSTAETWSYSTAPVMHSLRWQPAGSKSMTQPGVLNCARTSSFMTIPI